MAKYSAVPNEVPTVDSKLSSSGADLPLDAKSKTSRKAMFNRLVSFCRPEAPRIAIGFVALGVNAATNLSFPYILGKAVDTASSKTEQSLLILGQTAGVFVVGSLASWIRVYCLGTATDLIATRLRKLLFDSYIDMDVEFFDASSSSSGELMSILEKDVDAAAVALTDKLAAGLRSLNSSVNGSLLLYYTCPRLCAVSLAIVPLVGIGAMTMSKFSRKLGNQLREYQSQLMSFVLERFSSISTVRLNGREKTEKETYSTKTDKCFKLSKKSHFGQGAFMGFIGLSTNISLMAVLNVGGGLIATGELTPGSLTQFAMQSAFVCLGFSGLSTFYSDMVKAVDSAERVFNVIDSSKKNYVQSTRKESDTSAMLPLYESLKGLKDNKKSLVLEIAGVCFTYAARPDQTVLKGLDLVISPGSITAICGRSGCGKSTLLGIVAGLYEPSAGQVILKQTNNTADVEEGEVHEASADIPYAGRELLRSQVGVVEQSAGLLSGTIKENIAYGKENSTDAEIEEAAKAASAHEFILSFPDGYNTQVGEKGCLLSGGQRARVALARALVKDPACLLLDEATAALDKESEADIIKALQRLSRHKAVLVFTHSEMLMRASKVVHVMDEGVIVESGEFGNLKRVAGSSSRKDT